MLIRKMEPRDSLSVATVHTQSWQYAYKGIVSQSFLDALDIQKREEAWRKGAETNHPPIIRLVLESAGKVVGFATGLDNRSKVEMPDCDSELWAIYVAPDQLGKGFGAAIFKKFTSELRVLGKKQFCVWVLKENFRARGFYESQGGKLSSVCKEAKIGEQLLSEVTYVFQL